MFLRRISVPTYRLAKIPPEEKVRKLSEGILGGDRACLSSAVTLVESKNAAKKSMGQKILTRLLNDPRADPDSGFRIGLSGPPGAGKVGSKTSLTKILSIISFVRNLFFSSFSLHLSRQLGNISSDNKENWQF